MAGPIGAVLVATRERGSGDLPPRVVPAAMVSNRDADREADPGLPTEEGGWRARCLAALATYAEVCAWI